MPRKTTVLVAAAALAACGESGPGETGAGPELVRLDSVELRESDTLFVGRPRDFTVDPGDGAFLVSDGYANRVVRYARAGTPVRTYGHQGGGPGEFTQVGKVFAADSLLLAGDAGRGILNVFRLATGEHVGALRDAGILGTGAAAGGGMVLGAQSLERRTSLVRWTPGGDSLARIGGLPPDYLASQPLAGIFNGVHPAAWADSLLVGFAAGPELWLLAPDGSRVERVQVPAARRRGVPEGLAGRLEKMEFQEMFSATSVLFALRRLPAGGFALTHYDQAIDDAGNIQAELYLSLLSADRRRACVDTRVPASRDAQPRTSMRGDTLFVLEQRVDGQAARTLVTWYRVSPRGCAWRATRARAG